MPLANKGKSARVDWLRQRVGHNGDDCLTWPFSRVRGYGNLKYQDRITYAHRVMCELAYGPPPTDTHHAAHSCGRGAEGCVNPRHLSWKTPSENMLDKRTHGGAYRGGKTKKLTDREVRAIRGIAGRATHDEIAEWFDTSRRNVGMIMTGKSRRDVA